MKTFLLKAFLIGFYVTGLYAIVGELIIKIVHPAAVWFRWSVAGAFCVAPILMLIFIWLANRKA